MPRILAADPISQHSLRAARFRAAFLALRPKPSERVRRADLAEASPCAHAAFLPVVISASIRVRGLYSETSECSYFFFGGAGSFLGAAGVLGSLDGGTMWLIRM